MTFETFVLIGDGSVPNSRLPLLVYRDAVTMAPREMEDVLRGNGWPPEWHTALGMYPRHHFHSDAHEFIAVTRGQFTCRFGGDDGIDAHMKAGDAVVIPAGVAHIGREISEDLRLTGAFPAGYAVHDFRLGYPDEYARMVDRSQRVPIPARDPLFGIRGPLVDMWSKAGRG